MVSLDTLMNWTIPPFIFILFFWLMIRKLPIGDAVGKIKGLFRKKDTEEEGVSTLYYE